MKFWKWETSPSFTVLLIKHNEVVWNSNLMMPDFPHNIRIRLARLNFFLSRDVAKSLPCWLSQFRKAKLRQPTGQRLSNVGMQQKKIQLGQSYSYIMRKVWYHQIWVQNCLGFIVSDLMYMPDLSVLANYVLLLIGLFQHRDLISNALIRPLSELRNSRPHLEMNPFSNWSWETKEAMYTLDLSVLVNYVLLLMSL